MCAVMNGVSDLNLALAVHSAGAMPGLMISGDDRDNQLDHTLKEFVKCTGHANIVLQIDYGDLTNHTIINLIKQYKVSHVEIFGALDTSGVDGRNQRRSKYGTKKPKAGAKAAPAKKK